MKNQNKLVTGSVKCFINSFILILMIIDITLLNNSITAYAKDITQYKQTVTKESVFNTNSITKDVMEENGIERIEYLDSSIEVDKNTKLKNAINEKITNRIDVCKANTKVEDVASNINEITSKLTESKQKIYYKEVMPSERELCNAAKENVPNYLKGCRSNFKSYMAYTSVTSKASNQYKLLYSDEAYTDEETGIRMIDGRYCIALGTGYCSKIGTKINLVLENGNILKCILGDIKSDAHTDPTNRYHSVDGSVAEFIVDNDVYLDKCDNSGTLNWNEEFDGRIIKVVVLED